VLDGNILGGLFIFRLDVLLISAYNIHAI